MLFAAAPPRRTADMKKSPLSGYSAEVIHLSSAKALSYTYPLPYSQDGGLLNAVQLA